VQQREKRTWAVVEVTIQPQDEDMAGWLFMQLGAMGCQIEPVKAAEAEPPRAHGNESHGNDGNDGHAAVEPGSKPPLVLRATFDDGQFNDAKVAQINSALDEYGLAKCLATMRTAKLVEEDWLAKWKEGFNPFDVGERLIVTPPWAVQELSADRRAGRQLVIIEPGLAFGTGFHATTRFCLESIEKFLKGDKILDVGTGSGILAIAVAKLYGDKSITALETDPIACAVAEENFALNDVAQRVRLVCGSTEMLAPCTGETGAAAVAVAAGQTGVSAPNLFSTILSNLTAEDNLFLLPEYGQLLATGGILIMSGILAEKEKRVLDVAAAQSMSIVHRLEDGMWVGLIAQKP
jgi:ribosomal protein L11 methyltransferase